MDIAFGVLGGLGLFLYGVNIMGTSLQKVAGEKLKKLIEKLTNNRIIGVFVGAVVTMLIQSSSATTVMVVGFVNAGLMTLIQAIGVIMGANIGTTITAQLIAFKLTDIAPLVVAIGVGMWLFTEKKRNKEIAEVLIGFGILFIGMDFMTASLKPLRSSQVFRDLLISFQNPIVGILIGFGLTIIVQSSSASMALLLALASEGLITIDIALPILFGENIGTCVTALLSSIGASVTAKRAAFMHLLFNIIGTTIFIIILRYPIRELVVYLTPNDIQRQIANAHTFFNITNVIIQLPFASFIVIAAEKMIPGKNRMHEESKYLDSRIMKTPSIAVGQATKEVSRMAQIVQKSLKSSKEAFMKLDKNLIKEIFNKEQEINRLDKKITKYLVNLSNIDLTDDQNIMINILFNTINDLERVGDHADNIAEYAQYRIDNNVEFSKEAINEINEMFDGVEEAFNMAISTFDNFDEENAMKVVNYEKEIDKLEKQFRSTHIDRLNKHICDPNAGIIFLDLISNLERIADHSSNIALSILDTVE